MWLKVGLIIALVGGAGGLLYKYDANAKALGAAQQSHLQCEADLAISTTKVSSLNARITAANNKKLEELAKADRQVERANEAARQARADRQAAQFELTEAQRRYREAMANDANLQAYARAVVPVAVLDRLRSANGEVVPDR